ncbi:transcription factor IIA subunit alpha [Leucoagaricus gongylophorus]
MKSEFDEYGVSEEVLADLQNKWENKVIASHVAEFETLPQPQQSVASVHQPAHHPYTHAMHMMQTHYSNPYASITTTSQPQIKSEPVDNRYMLASTVYGLPGPNLSRTLPPPQSATPHPGGQTGVIQFGRSAQTPQQASSTRPYVPPAQSQANRASSLTVTANGHSPVSGNQSASGGQRIPQLDGPSESSGEDSPEPTGYGPRPSHPSLPQPSSVQSSHETSGAPKDDEAINSDLDDSDTENEAEAEEGGTGDTDIVFCTYDKVARVKNKWKCILKDGMIHINGKDYLFAKCTGEFEW